MVRYGPATLQRMPSEVWQILIVDDEPAVQLVLSRLFRPMGQTPRGVTSLREAQALLDQPWDLFFIDKNLPEGSGVELARKIREKHPGSVILLITGYPSKDSADELIGIVDEYVPKPFDLHNLREVVTSLMDMRALGRTLAPRSSPPAAASKPAPSAPRPAAKPDSLHIVVSDAREEALLLKAARETGFTASSGPVSDSTHVEYFILDGRSTTLELRKVIWQRQSTNRALKVAMVVDASSMSDSSAAVAVKAIRRAPRPLTAEAALALLSGLRD